MPPVGNLCVLALVFFAFVTAEQQKNRTSVRPLHATDLQRGKPGNATASPTRPSLLRLIHHFLAQLKPKEHKGNCSKGLGEGRKMDPEVKKMKPEVKKMEPEVKKMIPENKKMIPETKKMEPENKKMEPENKKMEPEDKKKEPEDKKKEPEDKKKEPEDNIDPSVRTRKEGCKIFYWKSWTAC